MTRAQIAVLGGGVIGLSLALELKRRGAAVVLISQPRDGMASTAAAGMLACYDPHNDPALLPLSEHSLYLYPEYLKQTAADAETQLHFETSYTLQQSDRPVRSGKLVNASDVLEHATSAPLWLLQEHSLDPRKLYAALQRAATHLSIPQHHTLVQDVMESRDSVQIRTAQDTLEAEVTVDCRGAWTPGATPVKGQMLRVELDDAMYSSELGNVVLRTEDVYIVPRQNGTAVIGATVEYNNSYDTTLDDATLQQQLDRAAALLPAVEDAPILEQWSGLRPALGFPHLPTLGATSRRQFLASGHFRNGILLAPATADLMANLLEGRPSLVNLAPYQPQRAAV